MTEGKEDNVQKLSEKKILVTFTFTYGINSPIRYDLTNRTNPEDLMSAN
jgi:hypothetical protein